MAMSVSELVVFREILGSFQEVGRISAVDGTLSFEYFGLFGGFCGRDSGIGPAQRAKTTIWN